MGSKIVLVGVGVWLWLLLNMGSSYNSNLKHQDSQKSR